MGPSSETISPADDSRAALCGTSRSAWAKAYRAGRCVSWCGLSAAVRLTFSLRIMVMVYRSGLGSRSLRRIAQEPPQLPPRSQSPCGLGTATPSSDQSSARLN